MSHKIIHIYVNLLIDDNEKIKDNKRENFHIHYLKFNTESIITIINQNEILKFSENGIDLIEDKKYY
jgi:hypothetical protein